MKKLHTVNRFIKLTLICLLIKIITPLNAHAELRVDMAAFNLPQLGDGVSLQIPTAWRIVNNQEAKASCANISYVSPEAEKLALAACETLNTNSIKVSKYPEPYIGVNPAIAISWTPNSNQENMDKVPIEARSEVCARTLENTILPKLKELSRNLTVTEKPTPIDSVGSGAWMTTKETIAFKGKENSTETLINRTYLLLKEGKFVLVTLSFPNKTDKETRIDKEILGKIFESFSKSE